MIKDATFLGIALNTQRRRRTLVVAYYALLIALVGLGLLYQRKLTGLLVIQTLTLGGFLGGILTTGPVKNYHSGPNPPDLPVLDGSGIQQLHLSGAGSRNSVRWPSLDEREVRERDRAHYIAYRTLRWSILPMTLLVFPFGLYFPASLFREAPLLLWLLVLYILSLPQSVILWTEPPLTPELTPSALPDGFRP